MRAPRSARQKAAEAANNRRLYSSLHIKHVVIKAEAAAPSRIPTQFGLCDAATPLLRHAFEHNLERMIYGRRNW